jgi:hypothetical protein
MPAIVTILFLFLFFSWVIVMITRRKSLPLSFGQAGVFLGCKIAAGTAYGYIYKRFYKGDDTWLLNHDGILQYNRLLHEPGLFFSDFIHTHPLNFDVNIALSHPGYFENLEYLFITKIMAPFNYISHGNYYINIVFFNFLTFWGAYYLFKLLTEGSHANKNMVALFVFLFPPFLFWTSGIRSEGFLLLFTVLSIYTFKQLLERSFSWLSLLLCLISLFLVAVLRNSFLFVLVPCLLCWWITLHYPDRPARVFIIGFAIIIFLVLALNSVLPPAMNPLHILTLRQHEFLALHGDTRAPLPALDETVPGLLKTVPYAIINVFLRPFPWEARGSLQWFAIAENCFFWGMIVIAIIRYPTAMKQLLTDPLALTLLFFGVLSYFIIGLVVPFPGAIVRYRIIPEVFILARVLAAIKTGKLNIINKFNVLDFRKY